MSAFKSKRAKFKQADGSSLPGVNPHQTFIGRKPKVWSGDIRPFSCFCDSSRRYSPRHHTSRLLTFFHCESIPFKGTGIELKSSADGTVGVCMTLEIQEGKRPMAEKDFAALGASTAWTLRLCHPFIKNGSVVCGDSAFASVATAIEVKKGGGDFLGIVKTASSGFPKKAIRDHLEGKPRGSSVAYIATASGVKLLAMGWKDSTTKYLISTILNVTPGTPHQKPRYRLERGKTRRYFEEVPRPSIFHAYFRVANKIDLHNRIRQGELGLERVYHTTNWHSRIISTVLGITITDSFLLYRNEKDKGIHFRDYLSLLAKELVENSNDDPLLLPPQDVTPPSSANSSPPRPTIDVDVVAAHQLSPLLKDQRSTKATGSPALKRAARRRCNVCHRLASFSCDACGVVLCGSTTSRNCLREHQQAVALDRHVATQGD